jgi:excinuclease ABC subunit B
MIFKIQSAYNPTGDQPVAINQLIKNIKLKNKYQVLLGITGSGKTFTMANVIAKTNKPALIISHNKTLAAQLYQEFRDYFPENAVNYFVSYYDYYQPEAYIPKTDTYIEKETEINEEIDKLRLSATTNILTRHDVITVASVSCIYNLGSPKEYGNIVLELRTGMKLTRDSILRRLVDLQYSKSNFVFKRGTFRVRGETIDIYPAYLDTGIRIVFDGNIITDISQIDVLNSNVLNKIQICTIYPAKHYMVDNSDKTEIFNQIRKDLEDRVLELKKNNKEFEAHRLIQRVNFDLEMITEIGYVNGIENYSRYFDRRKSGDAPYTLIDYYWYAYKNDWLLFIDESHITIPQIRGMYNGDRSRKTVLIDYGFRLPAALDNRPLTFLEFQKRNPQTIFVSATPDEWELKLIKQTGTLDNCLVEQLIRPTGIIDPEIIVRPITGQINDLIKEIIIRKAKRERVLVTTLTKKTAEDLSEYLNNKEYLQNKDLNITDINDLPKVHYLHSDILTLERSDILENLRNGEYDVLIGINLLREGLDLPEVSLVAILDADKEGFLRSRTSLIQTMGRAARHIDGKVIMYADKITSSMSQAIAEIDRRRKIQLDYNRKYGIIPQKIDKPIRERLIISSASEKETLILVDDKRNYYKKLLSFDLESLTPMDKKRIIGKLEKEMVRASSDLNFELAAELRDRVMLLKS